MSIKVNPPAQIRMSDAFTGRQLRIMERLQDIVFQLYRRTGGSDDAISTLENGELYESGIELDNYNEEGFGEDIELSYRHDVEERLESVENSLLDIGFSDIIERVEELESDAEMSTILYESESAIKSGYAAYDFALDGGTIGTINLTGDILPDNSTIISAWYEVLTAFTSAGAATVSFGVSTDDTTGLKAATAYNDAAYSSGYGDFTPDYSSANFTTKTTAVRELIMTIATADLTAGKVVVWFDYITS